MKISWKFLIFVGVVATSAFTLSDIFFALEPKEELIEYEVQEISPILNESVLNHIANSSKVVITFDDDLVNSDYNIGENEINF